MMQFSVYRLLLGFGLSLLMTFSVYAGFLDDIKKLEDLTKTDNLKSVLEQNTTKPKNEQQKNRAQEKEERKKQHAEAVERQRAERKKQRAERKKQRAERKKRQRAEQAKRHEDQRKAQIKAEEADWEAKVAEEKARKANKQVEQAEHEIYQEELDLAVKENEQAAERARKKYAAERVLVRPGKDARWHIARKGVGQFKKALNSYEVYGLSLGMKISVLEKTLISRGYKRNSRSIYRGSQTHRYSREKGKNTSTVKIWAVGFNDVPDEITISLSAKMIADDGQRMIADFDQKMIAEEKIRLLKAFSGACDSRNTSSIDCRKYTDTNELSIRLTASREGIQYRVRNIPLKRRSSIAR